MNGASTDTFVLVHGAWHGGWCWQPVAERLRARGHRVHTPTLTGLGERSHLLTPEVGLEVHASDLVATLEHRGLNDVRLVGHSYGSVPATLAATRAPERIRELVCLDGFVIEAGESAIDLLPPRAAAHYRDSGVERDGVWVLPPRPLERLGVTDEDAVRWLEPRLVPHPLRTFTEAAPRGAGQVRVRATYLQCTGWASPFDHMVERAKALGWHTGEVVGDHEVMVTDPDLLVAVLVGTSKAPAVGPASPGGS